MLRVGIAGINRGQYFAEALLWHPETTITALCDIDEVRLEREKGRFGNPTTYTDFTQMLDSGIDVAVVATPVQFHVPQSIEALERGINVFSEVPAAISLEQCAELVTAVRKSSVKYMLAENCCYMKHHMIVHNMCRAGLFGKVYYAEGAYVHYLRGRLTDRWRDNWLFGRRGGTYLTHALGPILQWLEDRVETVNCVGTGSNLDPRLQGDDSSTLLCKTVRGTMIVLRNDMCSPRPFWGYSAIQGTLGAFDPDWGWDEKLGHRVGFANETDAEGEVEWQPLSKYEKEFLPVMWRDRPPEFEKQIHGGADGLTVLDFIEAILQNRESPIDIYRAMDMTVPGIVSEKSACQGGMPVAVPNYRYL